TRELGVPESDSLPIEGLFIELRQYLETFRTLLVIDNLETINWEPLRPLLSDVPRYSKILITSRVGLGEIEIRYLVEPLDPDNAAKLARSYAKLLNVRSIAEAQELRIQHYCRMHHYNSLMIKWFIASVANGADPRELTNREHVEFRKALEFC